MLVVCGRQMMTPRMTALGTVLVLLTAQLLVDYPLGGERMDRSLRHRSLWGLVGHGSAHAAVSYLLLGRPAMWLLPVLVGVGHAIIDRIEGRFDRGSARVFFVGTGAHFALLMALVLLLPPDGAALWSQWPGRLYPRAVIFLLGLLGTVWLGGDVVGHSVAPFAAQLPPREVPSGAGGGDRSDEPRRGFPEGGRTIGYLERALIYLLVLAGQPGGVGFLVAAKSVFRFGELRERSNRLEAEYILIGTLASFLWGMAVSYAAVLLLGLA